ncbi:hypothetical protein [Streptomyces corynorhini]|uniref:Uncharacterized protein n=1 Tax=Streptomyces corynorhini TaxID=2282652 RepID=A0A370B182_9ACTN|nr:hypothetical protein [Streptomyces corynorhini]RDG35608.1 hypothetical protein DVH02_24460 [Streptomyces corynorhini]
MDADDADLRKELNATLQARRDLGEEYDSALVESFLERVGQRLDATVDRRVRRQLAEQQLAVARGASRPSGAAEGFGFGERFGFAVISLILAIPLSAIAVVNAGIGGLIVCWLGIVGVNALNSARRMPWTSWGTGGKGRGQESSDWEG